jgi:hypothetical protein
MILKQILNKYVVRVQTGFVWPRAGTSGRIFSNTLMNTRTETVMAAFQVIKW